MKTLGKSHKLDNVCYDIRGPVMDEANAMIAKGEKILKLNIGNPAPFRFRAPADLIAQMTASLPDVEGYSDSKGLYAAREAIAAYDKTKGIEGVAPDDIYTGNGASELITMSMQALLDNGDEVLVPAPDYPLWTASVTLAGGTAVHYICDEQSSWYPDIDDMRSKITDKTKGIVIINPNNPTGALYPEEVLQQIVDVAREHGLIIYSDEIYDRLLMDGAVHHSVAALAPDLPVITYNGLSKSHIVCGFRCGWMTASGFKGEDGEQFKTVLETLSSVRLCSNTFAQLCVPAALADPVYTKEMMSPGGRLYERREATMNAVNASEYLSVIKNTGALYCFVRIDPERVHVKDGDDKQFAMELVRDKHVMVVPGSGFDYPKPNYFRVVMLPEPEELAEAIKKIDDFCRTYDERHYK